MTRLACDIRELVPQCRMPRPHLVTGGQPEVDAWSHLARAGIHTIVNLRLHEEMPGRNEAEEVQAAGMKYINVPIAGAHALGAESVASLWRAMENAEGPVLVHCGSGNRCGAALALAEAWHRGQAASDALAFGREAGLTGMEPAVRELLR
jgi:uncharacterized protein (TIGR01244 family)